MTLLGLLPFLLGAPVALIPAAMVDLAMAPMGFSVTAMLMPTGF